MKGLLYLSWRHVWHHRGEAIILISCIAVSIFLPVCTGLLAARYELNMRSRAETTPLVAGARGSRFDLTLASLYFRQNEIDVIKWGDYQDIVADLRGVAAPMHTRFTARGFPLVGTTPDYFEARGIEPREGTLPLLLGDAIVGAEVARLLDLNIEDALFTDQKELYNIALPPAIRLNITGVLEPTGTADDQAVFVDVKTAWMVEGIVHGHVDVERELDDELVLGETDETVIVSGAMIEHNLVTEENIASFHIHGDLRAMPLTAVIVFPADQKERTLIKARVNNTMPLLQMVEPTTVIDDLLAVVFRIKSLFDGLAVLLAGATVLLTGLVIVLSMRIRAAEMRTLHRIGCSRYAVVRLYTYELLMILAASVALAAVGVITVLRIAGNLLWME